MLNVFRIICQLIIMPVKYELQRLKSECVDTGKDFEALNRIQEEQKRELVE